MECTSLFTCVQKLNLSSKAGRDLYQYLKTPFILRRQGAQGGPQCHMSNLRNGNVPCPYFCNTHVDFKSLISHVQFKDWPMSLIFFLMSIGFMSHVDFKKWLCRPVEFKGQGPHKGATVLCGVVQSKH